MKQERVSSAPSSRSNCETHLVLTLLLTSSTISSIPTSSSVSASSLGCSLRRLPRLPLLLLFGPCQSLLLGAREAYFFGGLFLITLGGERTIAVGGSGRVDGSSLLLLLSLRSAQGNSLARVGPALSSVVVVLLGLCILPHLFPEYEPVERPGPKDEKVRFGEE